MKDDDDIEKQLLALEGVTVADEQPKTTADVSEPVAEETDVENQLAALEATAPKTQPVDDVAVTDIPEMDETPEKYYLRTGQAPAGYKYVPSVPVSDTNPEENVKLERTDVATPSVAEQTEEAFDYQTTKEMTTGLYGEGIPIISGTVMDITGAEKLVDENVPTLLQPLAGALASLSNDVVAGLATLVVAGGETVTQSAEEATRFIHETFDDDNKIMGMTGKQLIPFSPKTSGKKFGRDLMDLLEVTGVEAPSAVAGTAKKALKQVQKEARKQAKILEGIENKKLRISRARAATQDEIAGRQARAAETAAANRDISDELIT